MIKKVLAVIWVLTVVVPLAVWGMSGAEVSAEDYGSWGWDFDETTHTLTILGYGDMPDYESVLGEPWYKKHDQIESIVITSGITSIADNAFAKCAALKSVTIPDTVTKIGDYAFLQCKNLKEVVIPDSVTEIGTSSFSQCEGMEKLTLSKNLTNIPSRAFYWCESLTDVTLPDKLTNISDYAFAYCDSLKGITIPDNVTNIGNHAFSTCHSISYITTGTNLLKIGKQAFYATFDSTSQSYYNDKFDNEITLDLSRSKNLKIIGEKAFNISAITSADIPDSVTTIEQYAFNQCFNLANVKLPKNLTEITLYAFADSGIESLEIPETVSLIGDHSFYSCNKLKKVIIPHSVITIDKSAFSGSKSLTAVDISGAPTLVGNPFSSGWIDITHVHIPVNMNPSVFAGQYGLPEDTSCYFQIGADGKCPAAYCPFRDGDRATGDVNGDGKINNTDIILLGRAYMAGDGAKYLAVADMNNDGRITNTDIILLGRLYMTGK